MTLGERIKQLRKENGLTQVDMAQKLGVTKGTVSTWETNSRMPSFDVLDHMCDMFQRSLDYLMGRSDDATPPAPFDSTLALDQVAEDIKEYVLKYCRLDQYGRNAVESVIRAEYSRCRDQGELGDAGTYAVNIRVIS
ncbi:XRE family transcriptional regulator [Clostridiaceae bacterium]|nr:XRE family transcriptional regulator [Clostridiaceae bacterium]